MTPSALSSELLRSYAPDPRRYRPLGAPSWLDEVDLSLSEAHARMGTRALAEDRWLVYDHLAPDEILLRQKLLAEQRAHVFACSPHAEPAAREVAHLVDQWLSAHVEGHGPSPERDAEHPLARAGGRIQEDLCLMVRHHDAWRLEGAMLCFPSLWLLTEKLGLPTALVHQSVPYYAEELSQKVDTMFDRFPAGKVVWRRNVSVWPALVLWAPCHRLDPSLYADRPTQDGIPPLWIRSERQTLRRLPETGAILFTIRVQTVSIAVLAHRPDRARDLAAWFRAPIGAVRRGQLGTHLEPMLSWLDDVSATG